MQIRDAFICEPVRTAVGKFGGAYKDISAQFLGAAVVKGMLEKSKLPADAIDDVLSPSAMQPWMRRRWAVS